MLPRESPKSEFRNSEEMRRQTSQITASNSDVVICAININDLAMENDFESDETQLNRNSNSRRGETTSKRSYENASQHSRNGQSPSASRRRPSSRSPGPNLRPSHYPRHHPNQRSRRISSSSPTGRLNSRQYSSSRSNPRKKRHHSPSRSPHERRTYPKTGSSQSAKEKVDKVSAASNSNTDDHNKSRKSGARSANQEMQDLSVISEDESTKTNDFRNDSTSIVKENPSNITNEKVNPISSTISNWTTSKDNAPDINTINQDLEISLFANPTVNSSSYGSTVMNSSSTHGDLLRTMEIVNRYQILIAQPTSDSTVNHFRQQIHSIINKSLELEQLALENRERDIKLQKLELKNREKHVQKQLSDTETTPISGNQTVVTVNEPVQQQDSQKESLTDVTSLNEVNNKPETTTVSAKVQPIQSLPTEISPVAEPTTVKNQENSTSTNPKQKSSNFSRRNGGQTRFSRNNFDSSIFSRSNKQLNLYADEEPNQMTIFKETNDSVTSENVQQNSLPIETNFSVSNTELKVTSSNSCRKVQIHHSNQDESSTSKSSSQDLRTTLNNNRTKSINSSENEEDPADFTAENLPAVGSTQDEITIDSSITDKSYDEKNESYDYKSQRNVTSSSRSHIDKNNMKRNDRRYHHHQRNFHNRSEQGNNNYSPSATNQFQDRNSYHQTGNSHWQKNFTKNKRPEKEDLRSRLADNKYSNSSRSVQRKN